MVSSSRRTAAGDRVSVVFGERPEGLSDALHAALFLIAAPSDELDPMLLREPNARRIAAQIARRASRRELVHPVAARHDDALAA
jgi:hypothetical protein